MLAQAGPNELGGQDQGQTRRRGPEDLRTSYTAASGTCIEEEEEEEEQEEKDKKRRKARKEKKKAMPPIADVISQSIFFGLS
jgi:hypothetical protein